MSHRDGGVVCRFSVTFPYRQTRRVLMPNLLGYPISTGMSFHLQKEGNITQNKSVTASLLTSFTLDYYYREMSSGCNTQRFLKQSPHFSCQPDDRMRKKKMTNAPTTLTRDELLKKRKATPPFEIHQIFPTLSFQKHRNVNTEADKSPKCSGKVQ